MKGAEKVPINNIFHMLCYAWNVLDQSSVVKIDDFKAEKPVDLLVRVLLSGVNHLLRYGIGREYRELEGEIDFIRGRVDFVASERRLLFKHGRAFCRYDELSTDFLNNQIIKSTLVGLYSNRELNYGLRKDVAGVLHKFSSVSDIKLSRSIFYRVNIHGNSRCYRLLMSVCKLVYEAGLLNNNSGVSYFRDFVRDERKMSKVYEKFVFNYYKKSQETYRVSSDRITWDASSQDDPELEFLPSMLTDITLTSPGKTIIIDAKYYVKTLNDFHGSRKIHASNLYQMNSYLSSYSSSKSCMSDYNEGVLLYPVVTDEISKSYEINGNNIRIETLNLNKDWMEIERDLMSLIA